VKGGAARDLRKRQRLGECQPSARGLKQPEDRGGGIGLPLAEPRQVPGRAGAGHQLEKGLAAPEHLALAAGDGHGRRQDAKHPLEARVELAFLAANVELTGAQQRSAGRSASREQRQRRLSLPRKRKRRQAGSTRSSGRGTPPRVPMRERLEPNRHMVNLIRGCDYATIRPARENRSTRSMTAREELKKCCTKKRGRIFLVLARTPPGWHGRRIRRLERIG
jgi:hypothetical protein